MMAAAGPVRVAVVLTVMLHARSAAVLARAVAAFDAHVRIAGADAASILDLMRLGAGPGDVLDVLGDGPAAQEAVDAVVRLVEGGLVGPRPDDEE